MKGVRRNDAYRLHRRQTPQQLTPEVRMITLRISKREAGSEMTPDLSLQSQSALPHFSHAMYIDSPLKVAGKLWKQLCCYFVA